MVIGIGIHIILCINNYSNTILMATVLSFLSISLKGFAEFDFDFGGVKNLFIIIHYYMRVHP